MIIFLFLSRLNPVSVFHFEMEIKLLKVRSSFLSRLNPVSVFHRFMSWQTGKKAIIVSIPPKSGLSFSQVNWGKNPVDQLIVSIPPKSGLSFSLTWVVTYYAKDKLFLSRLNPVSVFHTKSVFRLTQWDNYRFLSRLNPVSVFHRMGSCENASQVDCFYPA